MSDYSQYEIGLMCRTSYLLEQLSRTYVELNDHIRTSRLVADSKGTSTHLAHFKIGDKDYCAKFILKATDEICSAQFEPEFAGDAQ